MASLSALGSFGAALEIVLILYPYFRSNKFIELTGKVNQAIYTVHTCA